MDTQNNAGRDDCGLSYEHADSLARVYGAQPLTRHVVSLIVGNADRLRGIARPAADEELQALKALAQAATPGPWEWWTSNSTMRLTGSDGKDGGVLYGYVHSGVGDVACSPANAAYIAAANPAAIGSLIARVEQQAARIADQDAELLAMQGRIDELAAAQKAHVMPPVAAPAGQHEGNFSDLIAAVINLPTKRTMSQFASANDRILYKEGHRDARHAAVDLIAEFASRCRAQGGDTKLTDDQIDRASLDTCTAAEVMGGSMCHIFTRPDRHKFARAIEREVLAAHQSEQGSGDA